MKSDEKYYSLGLIGHPVDHSLSPVLHNAALAHHKLSGQYKLFDVEPAHLSSALERLQAEGVQGANVTIPHKQSVMSLLSSISSEAASIGAVNTIIFEKNEEGPASIIGENTDAFGFCFAVEEAFERERSTGKGHSLSRATAGDALLFGYGGAARAVVFGLVRLGFKSIKVGGRSQSAAEQFCISCFESASPWLDKVRFDQPSTSRKFDDVRVETLATTGQENLRNVGFFVNATPIGQHGEPVSEELTNILSALPPTCFVYDLVYSRLNLATPVVEKARSLELAAADGSGMLVHQAAKSFQIWTGHTGHVDVMSDALRQAIS